MNPSYHILSCCPRPGTVLITAVSQKYQSRVHSAETRCEGICNIKSNEVFPVLLYITSFPPNSCSILLGKGDYCQSNHIKIKQVWLKSYRSSEKGLKKRKRETQGRQTSSRLSHLMSATHVPISTPALRASVSLSEAVPADSHMLTTKTLSN